MFNKAVLIVAAAFVIFNVISGRDLANVTTNFGKRCIKFRQENRVDVLSPAGLYFIMKSALCLDSA